MLCPLPTKTKSPRASHTHAPHELPQTAPRLEPEKFPKSLWPCFSAYFPSHIGYFECVSAVTLAWLDGWVVRVRFTQGYEALTFRLPVPRPMVFHSSTPFPHPLAVSAFTVNKRHRKRPKTWLKEKENVSTMTSTARCSAVTEEGDHAGLTQGQGRTFKCREQRRTSLPCWCSCLQFKFCSVSSDQVRPWVKCACSPSKFIGHMLWKYHLCLSWPLPWPSSIVRIEEEILCCHWFLHNSTPTCEY